MEEQRHNLELFVILLMLHLPAYYGTALGAEKNSEALSQPKGREGREDCTGLVMFPIDMPG